MWETRTTDVFRRRYERFEKNRPRELSAAMKNAQTYLTALTAGSNPLQIRHGFVHTEGRGVYAVDQKGGGKNLSQIRLYLFPNVPARDFWLLTIGDKQSQKRD